MSGVSTNIFYEMPCTFKRYLIYSPISLDFRVAKGVEYLNKQPRGEDEIGLFLRFGNTRIEPILTFCCGRPDIARLRNCANTLSSILPSVAAVQRIEAGIVVARKPP